jgi:iron(III) transport system substrate-binding protein
LQSNEVKITAGNAMARNLVADGVVPLCLTDTDDANGALLRGKPVGVIYPDQSGGGTPIIPNTVALIRGAPHAELAKRFIEFLVSERVEGLLSQSESAQLPLRPGLKPYSELFDPAKIKGAQADWVRVAEEFDAVRDFITKDLKW